MGGGTPEMVYRKLDGICVLRWVKILSTCIKLDDRFCGKPWQRLETNFTKKGLGYGSGKSWCGGWSPLLVLITLHASKEILIRAYTPIYYIKMSWEASVILAQTNMSSTSNKTTTTEARTAVIHVQLRVYTLISIQESGYQFFKNFWDYRARRVQVRWPRPILEEDMWVLLPEEWYWINSSFIMNFYNSLPHRMFYTNRWNTRYQIMGNKTIYFAAGIEIKIKRRI